MTAQEFERYVYLLLVSTEKFDEIETFRVVGNREIDILAKEKTKDSIFEEVYWAIEIKKYSGPVPVVIIEGILSKLNDLRNHFPGTKSLLIAPSGFTTPAMALASRSGVKFWGLEDLYKLTPERLQVEIFNATFDETVLLPSPSSKEDALIESLKAIAFGKNQWSQFQQTTSKILEHLYCPPLETPKYELRDYDSRNRRDMIYENSAIDGFWRMIRDTYLAHYLVVDSKNYKAAISKQPIVEIAHYLKPYGCGMFGIIVSRVGGGSAAYHAIKEQWIANNKLILILSDSDIIEMLQIKKANGNPESVLRRIIADFRMSL